MSHLIHLMFLKKQLDEGMALSRSSDLLDLHPVRGNPPNLYKAQFHCTGFIMDDGVVRKWDRFHVGICFPSDYVTGSDPSDVVTWLGPPNIWHPHVSPGTPHIDIGSLKPGTGLVEILYRLHEVITYRNFSGSKAETLNRAAWAWADRNRHLFPSDRRPLRSRELKLDVVPVMEQGRSD